LEAQRDFTGQITGEVGLGIDEHAQLAALARGAGDARAGSEFRCRIRTAEDGNAFDGLGRTLGGSLLDFG